MASSRWSEQTVRKLEMLVNSYADAYRMLMQRIAGATNVVTNSAQLQAGVDALRNWEPLHA
jgi:hypothetical protein